MKYTPGPWKFQEEDVDRYGGDYSEPRVMAEMNSGGLAQTIAIVRVGLLGTNANGRLIACAPELLEVVRDVESVMLSERGHGFEMAIRSLQSRIEAAIAKAEGR